MLGAIAGDIIGSVYEWYGIKTTEFPLFQQECDFTDDTVMTIATAHSILNDVDYAQSYRMFGRRYPNRGYGGYFRIWLATDEAEPYNSWGNGSAMRVSPVGFAFDTTKEVLQQAKKSAEVTHNHPEGIKGAQATALAIYLARTQNSRENIKKEISDRFGYDLKRTVTEIRPHYQFDVSCRGTVPEAIIAFLESQNFEHAIRLAVSLGGDSDTLACITGAIAQAYYGKIPNHIITEVRNILPAELLEIVNNFTSRYLQ
ncbi:MAG: ADP-ribosylglycohydrolase family protein [Phycisphaerae bacterium]|nr:ADP-ribosylglycohydrolase family protein [Phycisphaerae bacterium]NIP53766.1 ADP-ribosylglycohydrolase family protein [Phycisphaerae bacterium]NIS52711.1 ADP-ribosylglycohydrolase family protein [Phycisphaerae bacterium]NIU10148.1 ADP-ribosylglycohydrolase family protein [Phycisphaerae bacterium]NIU57860.1 ADP-ribosylglycohydrolase family protein [Phycisphaerae bacterium]